MSERLRQEIETVTAKRDALLRQRDGLEKQIDKLTIQFEAYVHALTLTGGDEETGGDASRLHLTSRGLAWHSALDRLRSSGTRQFTTDLIMTELASAGIDMSRSIVRGRLADMVASQKLTRVSEGIFEFGEE
jgi:hypothetical protein